MATGVRVGAVRDVADGEDAVDRGLEYSLTTTCPFQPSFNAHFVEAEAGRVRRAADGEHDLIGRQ